MDRTPHPELDAIPSHGAGRDEDPTAIRRHDDVVAPAHAEQLADERARTIERIDSLQRTFDEIVDAADGVATDDEHDPEGHTIAWERQQTAALLDAARGRLAELDLAIRRIEGGDYGRCEACGVSIASERLEAVPTASRCVACAHP